MADFAIVPRYVRANPDVCTSVPPRAAPRVPAGPRSLAAAADPTRRDILAASALLPVLGLAASTALGDAAPASNLLVHFRRWQQHYRAIQASPTGPTDYDDWDIVCAAEITILESADTSLEAAEMRLWVALGNMACDIDIVLAEDIDALLADNGLDWDVQFVVRALADVCRRAAGGR